MNNEPEYDKPVAYDTEGRPLYYKPETVNQRNNLQRVHVVKDLNYKPVELTEEIIDKHNQSKKKYPHLNLSEGEYVISSVKRHPLGLISIWLAVIAVIFVILLVPATFQSGVIGLNQTGAMFGSLIIVGLMILVVLVGAVATIVYQANHFFLTNESVIQQVQTSLFSQDNQTVSLGNIEDASFKQVGILQTIFGYGSIRLSTQGDETTYRFSWVTNPKKQIDILNNTVEAFKNGRPLES